jgi:hypothetical protein
VDVPWLLQQRRVLSLPGLFYAHVCTFAKSLRHQVPAMDEPDPAKKIGRQQSAPYPAPHSRDANAKDGRLLVKSKSPLRVRHHRH